MTSPQYAGRKLLAAIFAASLTVLAAPAAGAHAATAGPRTLPSGVPFQLRNEQTGKCMQPNFEENFIATYPCNRTPSQAWISKDGHIEHIESRLCLEDFGNGDVNVNQCFNTQTQRWDDPNKWLRNMDTEACLADGNGYLYTTDCGDQRNERWIAEPQ